MNVSEKVLPKLSSSLARYIGTNVWKNGGDIRDVISIGKLVRKSDGPGQIGQILNTLMKYGADTEPEIRCTTGSAKLDSFLKGGIETQAITEIAGKSQICYTLCVTANMSLDKKRLGGNVIFIDTKKTFRSERIFQIAEHSGISEPDEILRRIYVCKIYNTSHLAMIIQDLGKSIEEYRACHS